MHKNAVEKNKGRKERKVKELKWSHIEGREKLRKLNDLLKKVF